MKPTKTLLIALIAVVMLMTTISSALAQNCTNCTMNVTITDTGATGSTLGVVLFVFIIPLLLMLLPRAIGRFSTFEVTNMIFVRGCYIVAFFMFTWAMSVLAEFVKYNMSGMEKFVIDYFVFIDVVCWALLMYFLYATVKDTINFLKDVQKKVRMGTGQKKLDGCDYDEE